MPEPGADYRPGPPIRETEAIFVTATILPRDSFTNTKLINVNWRMRARLVLKFLILLMLATR